MSAQVTFGGATFTVRGAEGLAGEETAMTTQLLTGRTGGGTERTWELELDSELPPASRAVTIERARAVADLLARIPGVEVLVVQAHCDGRFVLARLVVPGHDLADAVDRAAAFLRGRAIATGIGPLILVAARCAAQ
jgi:hypothetical protein